MMVLSLLVTAASVWLFMNFAFAAAHKLGRYDLVDSAWGCAFAVAAVASLLAGGAAEAGAQQLVITAAVLIWALRLASHIFRRFRRSEEEDPRYTELKSKWQGSVGWNAYRKIFMLQTALALLISTPVIIVNLSDSKLGSTWPWVTLLLGASIWIAGFVIEAVGDAQLERHKKDPAQRGVLLTTGLRRYVRHPNYLGELTLWWGIAVIALGVPWGWLGIAGPALLSFLIIKVSGLPPIERHYAGREDWRAYKQHTGALLPRIKPGRVEK